MALLASKRVRKNITAQIWNGGGSAGGYGQPTIIAFIKSVIPIPGEVDARFGGTDLMTMFGYCNECLNWSSIDGAGGTNRGNYLGYAVIPPSSSNGMFSSDEYGMYFSGQLPITFVSEGQIGSVLVYHPGSTTSTTTSGTSTASIPAAGATSISGNYLGIPEATISSSYFLIETPTGVGFNGENYVNNQTSFRSGSHFYQNVLFVTNSVGTSTSNVVVTSGTYISSTSNLTLEGVNLKISETF